MNSLGNPADTGVVERDVRLPDGVTLNVATAGPDDGPAVVFLHGFPDDWHEWRFQIAALAAAGYRCVAPDLVGCGGSDRPADLPRYRLRAVAGDVIAVMDDLGVDTAHVVGHDFGAALAWHVAFAHPERVERLTVVSVGHPAANAAAGVPQRQLSWYMLWFQFPDVAEQVLPADDWAFLRQWAWTTAAADDPDLVRQIALLSRPGALTAGLAWYRANIRPRWFVTPNPVLAELPRLTLPVTGVWSDGDPVLGEAQMTGTRRYLDGPWRYERLTGVDHWIPVHAASRLTSLLLELQEQRGRDDPGGS